MRTSKYILTADDYGACDFIDEGIIKAIKAGKINSVACFAVPFDKEDQLERRIKKLLALKKNYEFAIGLHFSSTAGRPNDETIFLHGNSLTEFDYEQKRHYFKTAHNYHFNSVNISELKTELISQITRLQSVLEDEQIDSLSNHHGLVYMNTKLFRPYAEVAHAYGIPVRSPVIWRNAGLPIRNWDRLPFNPTIRQGLKLRLLDQLKHALDTEARIEILQELKIRYPTCLNDEFYGQAYHSNLKALLEGFQLGTFSSEFLFHLGDPEVRRLEGLSDKETHLLEEPWGIDAGYFHWREQEFEVLLNSKIPIENIQKTNFRSLLEGDEALPVWHENS